MPSNCHTEFAPFVLDLLDFMGKKIREAIADESSRPAAIGEATGVVPLLRDRLREHEVVQTQFMLVFDAQVHEPHATRWWTDFACKDRAEFERQAADLIRPQGTLAVLRQVAAANAGASSSS
jgi:hypothetical protein